MRKPFVLFALAVCSLPAGAQSSPVFSSDAFYRSGEGARCGASALVSSNVAWRGAAMSLFSAPVTRLADAQQGAPAAALSFATPSRYAWRAMGSAAVGSEQRDCSNLSGQSRVWGGIERAIGNGGVMLAVGDRSLGTLDPTRNRAGITLGAWQQLRGARVTLELRRNADSRDAMQRFSRFTQIRDSTRNDTTGGFNFYNRTQSVPDSANSHAELDAMDVRTRAQWSRGRLAFDITAGGTASTLVRTGMQPTSDTLSATRPGSTLGQRQLRLFARADVRVAVASFAQVIGAVAALPGEPLIGTPGRRIGMLGMSFSSIPRRARTPDSAGAPSGVSDFISSLSRALFETVRSDSTTVRVRIRMPGSTRVELSSELTGWTPIEMHSAGDGWWEASLTATPGVYRVNVRRDGGAWVAPPGTSSMFDEFGGTVGLVSIG